MSLRTSLPLELCELKAGQTASWKCPLCHLSLTVPLNTNAGRWAKQVHCSREHPDVDPVIFRVNRKISSAESIRQARLRWRSSVMCRRILDAKNGVHTWKPFRNPVGTREGRTNVICTTWGRMGRGMRALEQQKCQRILPGELGWGRRLVYIRSLQRIIENGQSGLEWLQELVTSKGTTTRQRQKQHGEDIVTTSLGGRTLHFCNACGRMGRTRQQLVAQPCQRLQQGVAGYSRRVKLMNEMATRAEGDESRVEEMMKIRKLMRDQLEMLEGSESELPKNITESTATEENAAVTLYPEPKENEFEKARKGKDGHQPEMLEVSEFDSPKKLLETIAADENAMVTLDCELKQQVIEKARKENDVEHRTKVAEGLGRHLMDLSSDQEGGKVGEQDEQK